MTMTHPFLTLTEAAAEFTMPEHAVLRSVRDGDLPICFDSDETLTGVSIQHPDGTIEYVARPIQLSGVLACHGDTADADSVEAVGVRVLHVRSIEMGHSLPTVKSDTGFIRPGYVVFGFVDFARVEMADWLFFRDDLQAVKDGVPSGMSENAAQPVQVVTPAATITRNKLRTDCLDAPIEKAIQQAGCLATAAVFTHLKELALKGEALPFTGVFKGAALCYTNDDDEPDELTRDALRKRLSGRRKKEGNGG